jgi:hypothetical protein
MEKAGIDPAYIFASRETGFFITTDNQNKFSSAELLEFDNALEEFDRQQRKSKSTQEQRSEERAIYASMWRLFGNAAGICNCNR